MSNSKLVPAVNSDEWSQAAGQAREAVGSAGEMASHAASAVGHLASHAMDGVGQKADDLTASAGIGMQDLADKINRNAPQAGMLGNASQSFARTVKDSGQYLQGAKFSGITNDVAQLIRRNPITTILIAVGLGWFVGRKLRS